MCAWTCSIRPGRCGAAPLLMPLPALHSSSSCHPSLRRNREYDVCARNRRALTLGLAALSGPNQDRDLHRRFHDASPVALPAGPRHCHASRSGVLMPYEYIAVTMFGGMLVLLVTGQRVFAVIGFVAAISAVMLWGTGGSSILFTSTIKLMNWYPMLTLPMFIWMGYVMSETRMADDLYRMFHVWFGPLPGGLAVGTIRLTVLISAMNGLSAAGLAGGASRALRAMPR